MNAIKIVLSLSLLLGLFLALGCTPREPVEDVTEDNGEVTETEGTAEGFEMLSGEEFNLGHYKGSVVVVDLWATWCPPCKKEIPDLIEINNEYKDEGVVLIGISMDDNAMSVVPKYAAKVGMNYVNFDGKSGGLDKEYVTPGYPTKIFYDKDGKETYRQIGMMSKEDVVAEIEKLL
ncbi:MAG: TlpA family protein disulfide reductase [bacterium]|nr:TlpA family protein disulfide reductase [bacterium]